MCVLYSTCTCSLHQPRLICLSSTEALLDRAHCTSIRAGEVFSQPQRHGRHQIRAEGHRIGCGKGVSPFPPGVGYFKIVHSGAFSCTNSKVLFAIKCRERQDYMYVTLYSWRLTGRHQRANLSTSISSNRNAFTARHLLQSFYRVRQETAPFYFCNSFVRTSSFTTILGIHIYLNKFPIIHVFYILYIIRDGEPA